jgi:hypothetical protein
MSNVLYASVTNTTSPLNIRFSEAHNDSAPMITIECVSTTLTIGDSLSVDIGYSASHGVIFNGYVKNIVKSAKALVTKITGYGTMIRAVDYFLASLNPDDPFTRSNITAESLVGDLMSEAGLTDYGYDATSFTFATQNPMEVNLVSVYEFCNMIANTLAWHLYADSNGKVWFVDRKPYIMGGDSSSATLTESDILSSSHLNSERDLRNRIVVYGADGIYAEAKAESIYLPSGFYKTVVASAYWIDSQSMAQQAADYNLTALNRLTIEATITIIGDYSISARDVITVTETNTDISGTWYVYGVEHSWSSRGYTTTLILRQ